MNFPWVRVKDVLGMPSGLFGLILLMVLSLRLAFCTQYGYCDEDIALNQIFQFFGNRTWQANWITYPTGFGYLASLPTALGALVLYVQGTLTTPTDFPSLYKLDSVLAYLPARLTSVAFGLATVWLVRMIGAKCFSKRAGTIAAIFLCLSITHIVRSSLAVPDVTMAFFATCVLWFCLSSLKTDAYPRTIALAGLFAGFTIATKYNGGFVILPIAATHFIKVFSEGSGWLRTIIDKRIWVSACCCLAGFFVGCPGWLLTPALYWHELYDVCHFFSGGLVAMHGIPVLHHLGMLVRSDTTIGAAFIVGAVAAIVFRPSKQKLVLLSLILPAFLYISTMAMQELHLLLFIYPALAILAGQVLDDLFVYWCKDKLAVLRYVILGLVIAYPLMVTVAGAWQQVSLQDNRWLAYHFMQANIAEGSAITTDIYPAFGPLILTAKEKAEMLSGRHGRFFQRRIADVRTYRHLELTYRPDCLEHAPDGWIVLNSDIVSPFVNGFAPPQSTPQFIDFENRRSTYVALLNGDSKAGWKLVRRFQTGKGGTISFFHK